MEEGECSDSSSQSEKEDVSCLSAKKTEKDRIEEKITQAEQPLLSKMDVEEPIFSNIPQPWKNARRISEGMLQ